MNHGLKTLPGNANTVTVDHVLLHCMKYNSERCHLIQSLKRVKYHDFTLSGLRKTANTIYDSIITFVK